MRCEAAGGVEWKMKNRDEKMRQRYLDRELERIEAMKFKRDIDLKKGREISDKEKQDIEMLQKLKQFIEKDSAGGLSKCLDYI